MRHFEWSEATTYLTPILLFTMNLLEILLLLALMTLVDALVVHKRGELY